MIRISIAIVLVAFGVTTGILLVDYASGVMESREAILHSLLKE